MSRWADFQHYKKRSPPWIRLHRKLLDNPEWASLEDGPARLLVELWLIASDTMGGEVKLSPADLVWRLRRSNAAEIAAMLQTLADKGFIAFCQQYASALQATCYTEQRQSRDRADQSSVDKSTGASPVVENSKNENSDELRGEFALIVRKHLWQSKDAPSSAWTMGREFNIRDMLIERGESPETINGVYSRYRGPPATGKIYYAKNSRPRWEIAKSEYLKSLPAIVPKALSTVGDVLQEMGGAA